MYSPARLSRDSANGEFYPSLYLNIADNLRRLMAFEAASEYIDLAKQRISALSSDVYGETIRSAVNEVSNAIRNCDTARRPSTPGGAT
ncbi:hypothetical protein IEU95_07390 [Hoyosella rhizosphaerae]|uniref:hypothetical protein n=1 Tax=Hoyosella rhizosphaerae TaxID=1755582 RepID=UPI001663CFA6|nr:hypothetical protein [Hoyosella rhizosphaerae]MBN4926647.1 hypothetical protein [Hoyosella rhizosphaerae]